MNQSCIKNVNCHDVIVPRPSKHNLEVLWCTHILTKSIDSIAHICTRYVISVIFTIIMEFLFNHSFTINIPQGLWCVLGFPHVDLGEVFNVIISPCYRLQLMPAIYPPPTPPKQTVISKRVLNSSLLASNEIKNKTLRIAIVFCIRITVFL
jgi:hypothetical protein